MDCTQHSGAADVRLRLEMRVDSAERRGRAEGEGQAVRTIEHDRSNAHSRDGPGTIRFRDLDLRAEGREYECSRTAA